MAKNHTNLTLRNEYADANPWDETAPYFPRVTRYDVSVPMPGLNTRISAMYTDSTETHHIAGGILGTPKYDIKTNLVRVCRLTHTFCERYTYDGFVLCAAVKIDKGEWDSGQMAEIMRIDTVSGWIGGKELQFDFTRELLAERIDRI